MTTDTSNCPITLGKLERLKSRKIIADLFDKGKQFSAFPLKVVWIETTKINTPFPAIMSVSVSKRSFKQAVRRNRIKRQVRESYRQAKPDLYKILKEKNKQIALMFLFLGKEIPKSKLIAEKIIYLLEKIKNNL